MAAPDFDPGEFEAVMVWTEAEWGTTDDAQVLHAAVVERRRRLGICKPPLSFDDFALFWRQYGRS